MNALPLTGEDNRKLSDLLAVHETVLNYTNSSESCCLLQVDHPNVRFGREQCVIKRATIVIETVFDYRIRRVKWNLLNLLGIGVHEEKFAGVPKHNPPTIVQPDRSGTKISDPFEFFSLKRIGEDADFFVGVVDPAGKLTTIGRP